MTVTAAKHRKASWATVQGVTSHSARRLSFRRRTAPLREQGRATEQAANDP